MIRSTKLLLAFALTAGLCFAEANAQDIGLTYKLGTGETEGLIEGAGTAPAQDNVPTQNFNYWQEVENGLGGFQQAYGDYVSSGGDNYANLMTLNSALWLPGQASSSGMTMAQTGGAGTIQGGFEGMEMMAEAGTFSDTHVEFEVTADEAPDGEALVYYGTFSVQLTSEAVGGLADVQGPDVDVVAMPGGVVATWTNVFHTPATNTVWVPDGEGLTGAFAVVVDRGDGIELETTAETAVSSGSHLGGTVSTASATIGGVVGSFSLEELPGYDPPPGGGGGSGPGGPGGGGTGGGTGGGGTGGGGTGGGGGAPPGGY